MITSQRPLYSHSSGVYPSVSEYPSPLPTCEQLADLRMVVHQGADAAQTAAAVFGAPAAAPLERLQPQPRDERAAQPPDLGAGPGRGYCPPPGLAAGPSQPRTARKEGNGEIQVCSVLSERGGKYNQGCTAYAESELDSVVVVGERLLTSTPVQSDVTDHVSPTELSV